MSTGGHSNNQDPAAEPRRLGKYELIALIGEGGMAEVYLARQRGPMNFEKIVVVKTIHPHLARKEKFIKMLLDEARIAALLKHPSVVDIYDLGVEHGTYFIAMEHLAGEPLLGVLRAGVKKKPLDIPSTARLISDVADGLHAAHDLQDPSGRPLELVHRDITPGNIIVLYTGQVKIVDFGIAKARGRLADQTDADHFKGKLGYVAPEQVQGDVEIDRRADIFSLGVVMWEALALRRLFRKDNPVAAADAIMRKSIPPPSKFRSSVPPRLDSICMRALARDLNERYATAEEMHEDIERFLAAGSFRPHKATIRKYMQDMFGDNIQQRDDLLRKVADATTSIQVALPPGPYDTTPNHDLPSAPLFTAPVPLLDRSQLDDNTPNAAGQVSRATTLAQRASTLAPVDAAMAAAARRKRNKTFGIIAGAALLLIVIIAAAAGGDDSAPPNGQADGQPDGQPGGKAASLGSGIGGQADGTQPNGQLGGQPTPDTDVHMVMATSGDAAVMPMASDAGVENSDAAAMPDIEIEVPEPVDAGVDAGETHVAAPDKRPDKRPDRKPSGDPGKLYQDGLKLYMQGKLGPARAKFNTALQIKPNYANAHRGLGLVYERQGNRSKARRSFEKYLKLAPKARDRKIIEQKLKKLGG